MIRSIAIDDEPKALEVIKRHAEKVSFLKLEATFLNPFEALNYMNEHDIDLLFCDINMPELDGLSLVQNLSNPPLIIFTTAYSEYAVDSYELAAVDYLLKPFQAGRFLKAVNKAKIMLKSAPNKAPKRDRDFFFVNTGHQSKRLFYNEILYVESDGNYVQYHTETERILVRASMKETKDLLDSGDFVQIHRSYLVSLPWVHKVEDNHVYIGDKRLSISATYKEAFLDKLK